MNETRAEKYGEYPGQVGVGWTVAGVLKRDSPEYNRDRINSVHAPLRGLDSDFSCLEQALAQIWITLIGDINTNRIARLKRTQTDNGRCDRWSARDLFGAAPLEIIPPLRK